MRALITAVLLTLALGACATRTVPAETGGSAGDGVAPTLVVERFLQAANANDIQTMGRLFGTVEGPIADRDPRVEVEQRMYALASLLRHKDYTVIGEGVVPGRADDAVRILTRLTVDERQPRVPFTLIRSRAGRWLIEQIGMEELGRR